MPEDVTAPMAYRSVGINAWKPFDLGLVKLGAELGFDDLQVTMVGSDFDLYFDFRGRADETGLFDLARRLGMTTSLWVREFHNVDSRWGLPELANEAFWAGLRRRYEGLVELFPEVKYFVMTIVESDRWVTEYEPAVLARMLTVVNDVLRSAGKELIFRTFAWHPEQARVIRRALDLIPQDILISTKCVGNDWNYRQSPHPLIGDVGGRKQIVEMNLFGTWQQEHYVANAYPDEIKRRFDDWVAKGVTGVFVPPDGRTLQSRPVGNAQEMNLWTVGWLSSGRADSLEPIWQAFARRRFGEAAASTMIDALRPTGDVVREALCVGREHFGYLGQRGIPAIRNMVDLETMTDRTARIMSDAEAEAVPEDLEKYHIDTNPYACNFSTWRWDPSYVPMYHKIRKGDPEVIAEKTQAYAEALQSARHSLALLETVKDQLPEGGYPFFRFKLEENEFHLEALCEIELAWLKASNMLYSCSSDAEKQAMRSEVEAHLANLERLSLRQSEALHCDWHGTTHTPRRGEYLDIVRYIDEFRRYWRMEVGPRRTVKEIIELDTQFGKIKVLRIGDYHYHITRAIQKRLNIGDRKINLAVTRALTPPDQPADYSG